jgi:hypothetical protein
MSMRLVRTSSLLGAVLLAAAAPAVGSAHAAKKKPPSIKARPDNLMVGASTTLKGRGFPADSTVQLRECGRTFWIDPQDPCNTANGLSVQTDGKGRFKVRMRAEVCPEGESGSIITERFCYVGEPEAGEDTEALVGAVKITVTYP